MRDATGIHVQRAIAHILDHHPPQTSPTLSDIPLDLASSPELQTYFDAQVENALRDPVAGAAVFSSQGDQTTRTHCGNLLSTPTRFVASSQTLAQRLFDCMKGNQSIAPGTLAVCLYQAGNLPADQFLALMKIDPSSVLVPRKGKEPDGQRYVRFAVRRDAMPTAREKLQKAALMRPAQTGSGFEMVLLDRQTSKLAAEFFAKDFLNAAAELDAQARTDRFFKGAIGAWNRLKNPPTPQDPSLNPRQADLLRRQIDTVIRGESVNWEAWAGNLNLPAAAKEVITRELQARLPDDREFDLDVDYAEKKLRKKTRFRGQFGVVFEVETDHYRDVIREDPTEFTRQDGTRVTRLTLEVPNLEWVQR